MEQPGSVNTEAWKGATRAFKKGRLRREPRSPVAGLSERSAEENATIARAAAAASTARTSLQEKTNKGEQGWT